MYKPGIESNLKIKLGKLFKKDRKRYEIVMKKMEEILQNPHHYKPLSHDIKHLHRVNIDSSFVLVFSYPLQIDWQFQKSTNAFPLICQYITAFSKFWKL